MSPPTTYNANELGLSPSSFPNSARQIVEQLQHHGYEAYIVGGGVRDLLLGKSPKDFDITTSARPEDIKNCFGSRCRIIGRRFRLAHIRAGGHIIEVATFRGPHPQDDATNDADSTTPTLHKEASIKNRASGNLTNHVTADSKDTPSKSRSPQRRRAPDHLPAAVTSSAGMVLRDNVYGTLEEDAIRRDFTINALYYDPVKHGVLDFTQAITDIKTRTLRLIGDPDQRYREDPVRLLRAVRLMQKLNLTVAPGTLSLLPELAPLLHHIPSARLFDEVLKLFLTGHAVASLEGLHKHNLLPILFPATAKLMETKPEALTLLKLVMRNTDARLAVNKPVTPAFLFAAILWYPLVEHHRYLMDTHKAPFFPTLQHASDDILLNQNTITSIPKRFSLPMREIWEMQFRLPQRTRQRALKVLQHPRFRAGYDLLLLREEAKEIPEELGPWWTEFQIAEPAQQRKMLEAAQKAATQKKQASDNNASNNVSSNNNDPDKNGQRRRRKRRTTRSNTTSTNTTSTNTTSTNTTSTIVQAQTPPDAPQCRESRTSAHDEE